MEKIGIKEVLLEPLYQKYETSTHAMTKFHIALDTMEVSIKLITLLTVAILKEVDTQDYYEKKILKQLNRDNYSLGNHYFVLQEFVKYKHSNPLLHQIKSILMDKGYATKAEMPYSIWRAKKDKKVIALHSFIKKNAKTSWVEDLAGYTTRLRNKNAHTPTLNENNQEFIKRLFESVESILEQLKKVLDAIFTIEGLDFFVVPFQHSDKHREIISKYNGTEYNLSPLLIYSDRYFYFLTSLENSKSEYIEYLQTNSLEINTKEDKWKEDSLEKSLKIFSTHSDKDEKGQDGSKYKLLKSEFVGRDSDIEKVENHILENYENNTLTIIT
jgi:hypothetical protein